MVRKIFRFLIIGLAFSTTTFAQLANVEEVKTLNGSLQLSGIGTTNNQVPFWMRTNQFGNIPLSSASANLGGSIYRNYSDSSEHKKSDWSAGANIRLIAGKEVKMDIIEAFIKAKWSIFQLSAGRMKDQIGLTDSALSSGAFAVSGNALGIPRLDISIPDYWNIPGTKGLIALKGNFSFGYVGNTDIRKSPLTEAKIIETYYHQKSLYGRMSQPNWRLSIYGGFNHQVMFGSEREYLGPTYDLSSIKTLMYVMLGKGYGTDSIPRSKIGNHLGSIDQGVSYDFSSTKVTAYHQFYYDVGGLYHLSNIKDGLWGLSFENKTEYNSDGIFWKKFLVEFLYSKSQGGELNEKPTPSGDEDYYNNYIYAKGWTYKGENIGNNFFTNKQYQRKSLPHYDGEYIGNNRIMLLHVGSQWKWNHWSFINKFSFSRNYGTYATSPIGNTTGRERTVQLPPYFYPVNQFSAYIEASRRLKKNYSIAIVFATDYGDLLYNSLGGMVKLTKSW